MPRKALDRTLAEFTLACCPEIEDPEGCFSTGDDETDAEIVQGIRDDAEWNEWAWCSVSVSVRIPGLPLVGRASLGGCNYESAEAFKADPYFADLCDEAWEDLCQQAEEMRRALTRVSRKHSHA